jgi:uncharacterized protein YqeY
MLRETLTQSLKDAMKAKDARRVSTLRLILAALKDRDIASRTRADGPSVSEEEILQMLQTMIRQRRESIGLYEKGGRLDLAAQEQEEIVIIEGYLPRQMSEDEIKAIGQQIVGEIGAKGIKDMGRVMAALKQRYAGRLDSGKAANIVKSILS